MSDNESRIHNTFSKTIYQIENLERVFRDNGRLANAIIEIGGDPAYLADIQAALSTLFTALEEAEYGALAHLGSQEESTELPVDAPTENFDYLKKLAGI